jgi:hypothetical protein
MSLAVAIPISTQSAALHAVPTVILGTDAVLAALPATAVQLAHACLRAGFINVIPASWGDELIASATLRRLADFGSGPAIACSCPIVAHRLLSVGGDLRPVLLALVPPPVAVARYVHMLSRPDRARVTFVGACPGAIDDSIDIRMTPDALFGMLAERHIALEDQPRVFESIIPADRRRFRSQPGGLPAVQSLWSDGRSRTLVEIEGEDLAAEIAHHVLGGENILIDAATALGCACSGAITGVAPSEARAAVVSLEPPRANSPVVDEAAPIQLDLRVPAASRTPVDVMAVPSVGVSAFSRAPLPQLESSVAARSTAAGTPALPPDERASEPQTPSAQPPFAPAPPVARRVTSTEVRTLPRAYFVRRRLTPRSTPAVPVDHSVDPRNDRLVHRHAAEPREHEQVVATEEPTSAPESRAASEDLEPAANSEFSNDAGQLQHTEQVEPASQVNVVDRAEPQAEAEQTTRFTPAEPPPPKVETAVVQAPPERSESPPVVPTPLPQFSARKIVLVVLAVVALMIVVSAAVAVFVERRFSTPISLSLPSSEP